MTLVETLRSNGEAGMSRNVGAIRSRYEEFGAVVGGNTVDHSAARSRDGSRGGKIPTEGIIGGGSEMGGESDFGGQHPDEERLSSVFGSIGGEMHTTDENHRDGVDNGARSDWVFGDTADSGTFLTKKRQTVRSNGPGTNSIGDEGVDGRGVDGSGFDLTNTRESKDSAHPAAVASVVTDADGFIGSPLHERKVLSSGRKPTPVSSPTTAGSGDGSGSLRNSRSFEGEQRTIGGNSSSALSVGFARPPSGRSVEAPTTQHQPIQSGQGGSRSASPNAFVVPRNPRDTASSSPKRRILQQQQQQQQHNQTSAAASQAYAAAQHTQASGGGGSLVSAGTGQSRPMDTIMAPLPANSRFSLPQLAPPPFHDPQNFILRSDPDAEEQAMFEQRLCEDEFGVAVRKINHNGKAQLRYVKCIPLRPASPSSQGGVTSNGGVKTSSQGSRTVNGSDSDRHRESPDRRVSGGKSVSSLMGRIGRGMAANKGRISVNGGSDRNSFTAGHSNASTPTTVGPTVRLEGSYQEDSMESQRVNLLSSTLAKRNRALTWGNKKKVKISLDRFIAVRKGKTTDRTRRNSSHPSRLLSIITDDRENSSLDIEAPTRLDRDKFARAFARFLGVPLESDSSDLDVPNSASTVELHSPIKLDVESRDRPPGRRTKSRLSAAHSAPDTSLQSPRSLKSGSTSASGMKKRDDSLTVGLLPAISHSGSGGSDDLPVTHIQGPGAFGSDAAEGIGESNEKQGSPLGKRKKPLSSTQQEANLHVPKLSVQSVPGSSSDVPVRKVTESVGDADLTADEKSARNTIKVNAGSKGASHNLTSSVSRPSTQAVTPPTKPEDEDPDEGTEVSSLTQGFDQELVEELHNALTELRAELDASRAEAARAVKVAEQAIQSAESCTSNDWNSTVTHKAAEAAAQAQKRSAEAMAKQRLAEERLASEKKNTSFWRRQAEAAEEEAGTLQTRAASAEVRKAALAEELESERRTASSVISDLRKQCSEAEKLLQEHNRVDAEKRRHLEVELDIVKRDLQKRGEEVNSLGGILNEVRDASSNGHRKVQVLRHRNKKNSSDAMTKSQPQSGVAAADLASLTTLSIQMTKLRTDYELLRRSTAEEIDELPTLAEDLGRQAAQALSASQKEVVALRNRLARESAMRRKLLNEVQDLRGTVRVYCRPRRLRSVVGNDQEQARSIISSPSHEVLLLHKDSSSLPNKPGAEETTTFEFDRIFSRDADQKEVYSEMEELVFAALDGFKVCILAYGQTGSGKTYSLLGDCRCASKEDPCQADIVEDGIQLLAAEQLFSIAERRRNRYQDTFSMTIVEVHNEKLRDLIAGTEMGEEIGEIQGQENTTPAKSKSRSRNRSKSNPADEGVTMNSSVSVHGNSTAGSSKGSRPNKLEIRTNYDGETVVQGLVSVPLRNFQDVRRIWKQCLVHRSARLSEQGVDFKSYEAASHVIATINILSTNTVSGVGTLGKLNFVDLAGSDLVPRRSSSQPNKSKGDISKIVSPEAVLAPVGNNNEWKFANRSLSTLNEVVHARSQFVRSVPYRNSTLTHLLRDCFEADTKMLLLLCISCDAQDLQQTASALRFASRMKKVSVGKATKHTISVA